MSPGWGPGDWRWLRVLGDSPWHSTIPPLQLLPPNSALGAATPAAGTCWVQRAVLPETHKNTPSSTSVLSCNKWPKIAAAPYQGTFWQCEAEGGQQALHFIMPNILLPLVPPPHAEHHWCEQLPSSFRLHSSGVFYFKLQQQKEHCKTEMGTEQVPATGPEPLSSMCCITARRSP